MQVKIAKQSLIISQKATDTMSIVRAYKYCKAMGAKVSPLFYDFYRYERKLYLVMSAEFETKSDALTAAAYIKYQEKAVIV